jgi:DNA-binding CsgD family transcriptional regulator
LPSTYRCHDLFRDFLERELHALGNAELRSVLVRGARALHESGDAVAALGLAVKARAADEIVDILRNDGFALLDRAHTDTVQKAIGALDGSRAGDAIVLGLRAQMEANGGHLVEAKLLFRQAIATCPDAVLKATLQLNYAIALCSVNDRACLDVLETAAEPELPAETRGPVLATLVFYYAYFGDYEKVRAELLDEIERLAWVLPSDVERAKILQRVGAATFLTGDFTRSRRVLERSAELALKCNLFRLAHSAYSTLCAVTLIGDEDVPRAASYARSDAECAERSSEAVRIRGSLLQQVDVTIREGGRDALRRLVDAFEQFSTPKDARIEPMVALAQGVLAAWDGEIGRAGTLVAAVCDQLWLQEERLLFRAFAAVLHAAGGDSEATKVAIAAVEIDARKPDSLRPSLARHQQRARLLCALAQAIGGRFSAARRLLHGVSDNGSALTSALERAVVSIVEEVHDGIASDGTRISLDALREIHYGGYADVLEAVAAAVRRRTTDAPLTAAEVAVLSALALGRRPKEIAADTGRSVNTVRTLIARVIDKLGCSGREQAVRIARSRGII